jgi:hypothetical protein
LQWTRLSMRLDQEASVSAELQCLCDVSQSGMRHYSIFCNTFATTKGERRHTHRFDPDFRRHTPSRRIYFRSFGCLRIWCHYDLRNLDQARSQIRRLSSRESLSVVTGHLPR